MSQQKIRDELVTTLDHIERVWTKLQPLTGNRRSLTFPDTHKLSEGLFLASWTHWEQFLRELFVEDLSWATGSAVRREVKKFRTKNAPERLAELVVGHPDTKKWIEWSEFSDVLNRANSLLGANNRFAAAGINQNDLTNLKRIRNAIAHKSDSAWESFRRLAQAAPFSLAANQMRGITVGRFLTAHQWNGMPVLRQSLQLVRANAQVLVP